MKLKQPIDVTKPLWNWRKDYGRLRIAWISKYRWWLCGAYTRSWWFVFRYYPVRDAEFQGLQVGGYFQITILGLQLAYCYRKDFQTA